MPSGAVSGQYADIKVGSTSLVEATRWEMDESVVEHAYASQATGGYKARVVGPKDKTGTLEGIFDPANPIHSQIAPGDQVTLLLYVTASKYHSIPAKILTLNHGAQIEEGDPLRWTASWGLNGTPALNQTS